MTRKQIQFSKILLQNIESRPEVKKSSLPSTLKNDIRLNGSTADERRYRSDEYRSYYLFSNCWNCRHWKNIARKTLPEHNQMNLRFFQFEKVFLIMYS